MIRPSGGRLVVTVRQDPYADLVRRNHEWAATDAMHALLDWWVEGKPFPEAEDSAHLRHRREGPKVWSWRVPPPKGHPLPPALHTLRGRASSMEEAVADGLARLREVYDPQNYM